MKTDARSLYILTTLACLLASPAALAQTEDVAAPVLRSFSFTPASVDATAGPAKVTVTMRVTDDLTGVNLVYANFFSSSGQRAPAYMSLISGDKLDGIYRGTATFPKHCEAGAWKVTDVGMRDSIGNRRFLRQSDLTAAGYASEVQVTSNQDVTAPMMTAFSFTPHSINTASSAQAVTVTMSVTDDLSGVDLTYANFHSPSGKQVVRAALQRVTGTAQSGTYSGTATFPAAGEAGDWKVDDVGLRDSIGNRRFYKATDLQAAGLPFVLVVSSFQDTTAPLLRSLTFAPTCVDTAYGPATVKVTARATDDHTGVNMVYLNFRSPSGQQRGNATLKRISGGPLDGLWEGTATLPRYSEQGRWTAHDLGLRDGVSNWRYLTLGDLQAAGYPVYLQVGCNKPPAVDAGPDRTVIAGEEVTLDGSNSSDGDGTLVSHSWSLGDGTSATGKIVKHTYAAAGSYTVSLSVTDDDGASASDSAVITVISPLAALQQLRALVFGMGLHRGTQTSLLAKADNASKALVAGDPKNAAKKLGAFTNEVQAQQGKKITAVQGSLLLSRAGRIIAVLQAL